MEQVKRRGPLPEKRRDLLNLINRSPADSDGWTTVSKLLWPIVQGMPEQLVEYKPVSDGGYVRLTPTAKTILEWT